MPTLNVTKEHQGRSVPTLMTVVPAPQHLTDEALERVGAGAKLDGRPINGRFLADLLSAFCQQERSGVRLYRAAERTTEREDWLSAYREFREQTERHVAIYERLISELGGNPAYVSPSARLAEFQGTKLGEVCLIDGSIDPLTQELACLEGILLAELRCHANWHLLKELTDKLPESPPRSRLRRAVEEVEDEEDRHVHWAKETWQQALLAELTAR